MLQTTASDVQVPASATPAPTGVSATTSAPAVPIAPISQEQAVFLRARRTALTRQLESVQHRRDEVADVLRNDDTRASERPGLQQRLDQLDQRLISLERDIAANSEQLANAPAEPGSNRNDAIATMPPGERPGLLARANPNTVIFFSFLLLMPVMIQLARRLIAPKRAPSKAELAELAALRARMEQMDGAIDAVAVEVERIGEGQRFLTQAMTANLQRSSSELGAPLYEPAVARVREATERR